ncbi:MAG: M20/M25/M40 family metallo-hydrolase [Cytophagaceae bacterium]|nr:M20/M25/M40 family metallo-hydrolase [Gemmatimonadaceae bacterium]
MKSASDWVISQYKSWGIDAKRDEYGTWRGWRRGVSHIDLVGPRVRSLEGQMLAWSPGTNGKVVTAQAIVLPKFRDSTEFVKWLPQAKGKIVLLSPAWPTCRPSEDWFRFATPDARMRMDSAVTAMQADWSSITNDSTKLYRGTGKSMGLGTGTLGLRLEQAGVAGMLTSRLKQGGYGAAGGGGFGGGGPGGRGNTGGGSMRGGGQASSVSINSRVVGSGSGGWGTVEVFETYNTTAPAVTLSCEDYSLIYRLAENNQKPMVRLDLDAQLLGEVPAFNTIGTIKGTEKPDEYVMLSAHFDSWDGGSGATDNGTGTLMAMEAMRILKKVYPNPKRTIMVGHWSSEEQGLNGSRAFATDHPEVLKGLQALFNQDNGTGRVQSLSAAGLTAIGPHLRDWHGKLPSFFTDSMSANAVSWAFNDVPTGNPGGTDGAVFACYGTPSFGMGAVGWNYGTYTWHTQRDTYDKVVFDDLKHNATLAAMMAYLASEDPVFIDRTKSPGTWPANWPANCGLAPRQTRARY